MRSAPVLVLLILSHSLTIRPALAQREVTPEARIFRQYREGVFTVFGDGGHGSGFLINAGGLVLTNQHVIANSKYVRVQLDDSTKVAGQVIAADAARDVAVVRIHSSVAAGLPVLQIAPRRQELAFEGERVIAIGSPLNQTKIVTSGIVSKVEEGAIISDVNINPGNSGGPLLNMDGEVVGINTFADPSGTVGPGVSGSISIYLAEPLVSAARAQLASTAPPAADRLPVMPKTIFPLAALEQTATAERWDDAAYDVTRGVYGGTGGFTVKAFTPPYMYRIQKQLEIELAAQRQRREAAAGATPQESYSPFDDLKSWAQYTGEYAPVVLLQIAPKVGETTGSTVANILGAFAAGLSRTGYRGSHRLEFKGDLKDVTLRRNGLPATEIQRGMTFVPLLIAEANYYATYYGKDLARAGVLVLEPGLFQPEASGWPEITLHVEDLKKPDQVQAFTLPRQTVERIWADFEPHREQLAADRTALVLHREVTTP